MKPEKNYNVFEIDGTIFLENHEEGSYHIGESNCVDINCLNDIADELNALHEENEHYKALFFEIVETALTDKNCKELYCKGILRIFDKSNSLNQARERIKAFLEVEDLE